MPERRATPRPEASDRRRFPRPPLWLTLGALAIAIASILLARCHRSSLDVRLAEALQRRPNQSGEMNQVREQLAAMDLSEEELRSELEARAKMVESLENDEFYISIDTEQRKFRLQYGSDIVREADLVIGEPATFRARDGAQWTFAPLRGAFEVTGKETGLAWRVPIWVYLMNGKPPPPARPVIRNGIGTYVILLPNSYIIHSPPSASSPLKGAKPASFMVPESDLRAIWPRVRRGTKVFVF